MLWNIGNLTGSAKVCDITAVDLEGRPYDVAQVGAGWILRTKPAYAPAIRAAADVGKQALNLSEFDLAVLAAIAVHQPISRDGLKDIFGKEISRDLIGRLAMRDLIGTGPRKSLISQGCAHTFPYSCRIDWPRYDPLCVEM